MSAVLAPPENELERPHWLAGVGGFELSDPEEPPLEHGLTATEERSARYIHCRMDWTGVQVTLWAAPPGKVSDRQTLRNEREIRATLQRPILEPTFVIRILPPQPASAVSAMQHPSV